MTLRSFLGALAIALVATYVEAAQKNVVLIVADDMGPNLGCYGNSSIKTPHLDAIAADATLFTYAFTTTASCSPSRSVILSGMYSHANGQYGLQHGPHHFSSLDKVRSLTARLRDVKYRTMRIGKFHVGPEAVYPFDETSEINPRNSVAMADRCREFIAADDERPFFLYFCVADPHRSGSVGPPPHRPNLFGNDGTYAGISETRYDPNDVQVPSFLPDTPTSRAELAQYCQSVSRLDQGVGRLVQVLKDTGHWDDTLLVFISDNGIPFPGAKTTTYEPGLRLPCLVRNPYLPSRGLKCQAMISWVDIAPTILEFAGASAEGRGLQGRSFLKVLEQPKPPGWDEIYASHTFHEVTMYYPMRVVRSRRFKLIWNLAHALPFPCAADLYRSATWQEALTKGVGAQYGQRTVEAYSYRPAFELYDLETDPGETHNLAGNPDHARVLAELKNKLRAFQERTADPWLHKWEYE